MDIPTAVLKTLRANAGVSQQVIAQHLGVSVSVVSRLETNDSIDETTGKRYLEALGTPEAIDARHFYQSKWEQIEGTSFLHPDRQVLREIEQILQELASFEKGARFDEILRTPVHSLQARLRTCAEYLRRLDHDVAWVGDLGVGKTTALSHITNLTLADPSAKRKSVFPTGSGRVTVCEVVIKTAPTFGVAVECLDSDQVRALVAELVGGIKQGEASISSELDRVLRNMSGLNRTARIEEGKRVLDDPLRKMIDGEDDIDAIVDRIVLRMNLGQRTQSQIILSGDKDKGIRWLSENVTKINHGQHSEFSVPHRITVLVPPEFVRKSEYELRVVDTKGVEGSTKRPDLRAHLDNPRTLTVLCSKFSDAPGATPVSILKELDEAGSDAVERDRLALLVLPRTGEAENTQDDSGSAPSTIEDGYLVRDYQVRNALETYGIKKAKDFGVIFYDVGHDDPEAVWNVLNNQVVRLREHYRARAKQLCASATNLMANPNVAKSEAARRHIAAQIAQLIDTWRKLPDTVRPAHQNLVDELNKVHPSSVAAAVNRKGTWNTFDVHHILGTGVRSDANARTRELFSHFDKRLVEMSGEFKGLSDIREFLASLRDELKEWKQEYLLHAHDIGRTAFTEHLDDATDLWKQCRQRWGGGQGYRNDIAEYVRAWFEENLALNAARKRIDRALRQAWEELVLQRLEDATAIEENTDE